MMTNQEAAAAHEQEGYPKEAWARIEEKCIEISRRFVAYLEGLMEERGIEDLEELHRRFLETEHFGYVPVPGLHRGKPVSLKLFYYLIHQHKSMYPELLRGLGEALELDEEERRELMWFYVFGEPRPEELRQT